MSETKIVNFPQGNFAIPGFQSTGFQATIKILGPSNATGGQYFIAQGTGQGQRIGNKISTVRAILSGAVHINTTYDGTANWNMCPLYVGCYIFRLKGALEDSQANAYTVMANSFFQNGNGQQGFSGRLVDLTKTPNGQTVTLLKKRVFKVGTQFVNSAFGVASANNANQQYSDGSVGISRMFKMDITKTLQKIIQFNDANNAMTNANTWIAWVPFRVDGNDIVTSLGSYTGALPCYVDYNIAYNYRDM